MKHFTEKFTDAEFGFVMSLMERRNEELHSGACSFMSLSNKEWLPRYYRVCRLLADGHGFSFDELFGLAESEIAQRVIEETEKECTSAVKKRIAAYTLTFEQMTKSERDEKLAKFNTVYSLTRGVKKQVECPACNSQAILTGEEVSTGEPVLVESEICQEATVIPTGLDCEVCGLHLRGLPELHAATLDDQFVVRTFTPVTEYYETDFRDSYFEPEYMNS